MITRGGSGPCYGMVTSGGVEYALWSEASPKLEKGDRIRARLSPNRRRIMCGSGEQVQVNALEQVPAPSPT